MPTIEDRDRLVGNCAAMVGAAKALEVPILVTEQYVKGLGRTVEPLASALEGAKRVEKTRFSALVDEVDRTLAGWGRSDVIVCGIEAHVCVLQTVLDLLAGGKQAWLVTDAISAGQSAMIEPAIRRMERAGAVPTGVVSASYEMMKDASHPAFRACLEVAKAVRF